MLKKSIFYIIPAFLLYSCNSGENTVNKDNNSNVETGNIVSETPNIVIKGTLKNSNNNNYLTLEVNTENGGVLIDDVEPNEDGTFELETAIKGMGLYFLRLNNKNSTDKSQEIVPLTLVPNDEVTLELDAANYILSPIYKGTDWGEVLNGFMVVLKQSMAFRDSIDFQSYQNEDKQEELMSLIMKSRQPIDKYIINEIQKNPTSPAHIVLMMNLLPSFGFDYFDIKNMDALKILQGAYSENYPDNPMAKGIVNQIEQIAQSFEDYRSFTVKNEAPEISLPDPNGKELKLSSLRGNYVLIDFWAAWCRPCRVENPNLVRLYNKYKDENFEVFSVSLDDNKQDWVAAINQDKLDWEYHVSDLKKWNSPLVTRYQFNGIPHTVLVDPDGKILARNLRGITLERKLQEVFGK